MTVFCNPTMKILRPNTLGAVSSVVEERKGDCGPAVPAASVGVVDGVKLEKTALWGCISHFWKDSLQLFLQWVPKLHQPQ